MFNFINLCISYCYLYHNDHCTFLQNKTDLFFLPWLKYTGFLCLILLHLLSPSSHPHGVKVWYCTLVSLSAWEPQKLQADIDIDRTACFGCISHSHNAPSLGAVKVICLHGLCFHALTAVSGAELVCEPVFICMYWSAPHRTVR